MEYNFSKKDIKISLLNEGNDYKIYQKKNLVLNEDMEDTSFASDVDDLDDAKNDSKTNDVVINKASTDGNSSTNIPTLDIDAKNVSDAKQKIKQNNINPNVNKLGNNVNYKVHIQSSVDSRPVMEGRKNSVRLTKSELNEMFKK